MIKPSHYVEPRSSSVHESCEKSPEMSEKPWKTCYSQNWMMGNRKTLHLILKSIVSCKISRPIQWIMNSASRKFSCVNSRDSRTSTEYCHRGHRIPPSLGPENRHVMFAFASEDQHMPKTSLLENLNVRLYVNIYIYVNIYEYTWIHMNMIWIWYEYDMVMIWV